MIQDGLGENKTPDDRQKSSVSCLKFFKKRGKMISGELIKMGADESLLG
jgi:hypothetical protein